MSRHFRSRNSLLFSVSILLLLTSVVTLPAMGQSVDADVQEFLTAWDAAGNDLFHSQSSRSGRLMQGPTAAQFNGSFSASSPDAAGIVAINGAGSFASQTADQL